MGWIGEICHGGGGLGSLPPPPPSTSALPSIDLCPPLHRPLPSPLHGPVHAHAVRVASTVILGRDGHKRWIMPRLPDLNEGRVADLEAYHSQERLISHTPGDIITTRLSRNPVTIAIPRFATRTKISTPNSTDGENRNSSMIAGIRHRLAAPCERTRQPRRQRHSITRQRSISHA
jgi:hypothetical protein